MNSLLVRFFVMSVLIAGCAIAVTAWLASQATTGSIRQEQGEQLATDALIYDELLGYAAEHKDWSDVKSKVDSLARKHQRRIALQDEAGNLIADSGSADAPRLPVNPKVGIDPLNVNTVLKPGSERIDDRAIGPFRLTEQESQALRTIADEAVACNPTVTLTMSRSGRPELSYKADNNEDYRHCGTPKGLYEPTATEQAASAQLIALMDGCLQRGPRYVRSLADTNSPNWFLRLDRHQDTEITRCLRTARNEQLRTFVAPPAKLFLTEPAGAEPQSIDLSTAGVTRITLTALGILVLAGFAAWLTAKNLVRPIRALTAATNRMSNGDRSVRVETSRGELGELARSFNSMSEKLADTERQRKAMVSDVAHELRTPLGNITGWLEATQDGVANADPALIAMLLEESLLLERLVDDLQDLAQADAGTLRLHPEPVVVSDVVEQVVAAHHTDDVWVTARTDEGLSLTADPTRLRQALGNLVANAIRYTPSGGAVAVRAFAENNSVVFEVADTGVGIEPDDLPHVFDRFWRADRSRSRATGGSGLGLAITRHLVEAHGGSVSVTSTPGEGSTFRLTLPG